MAAVGLHSVSQHKYARSYRKPVYSKLCNVVFVRLTQEGSLSKIPSVCRGGERATVGAAAYLQVWAFCSCKYFLGMLPSVNLSTESWFQPGREKNVSASALLLLDFNLLFCFLFCD